MSTTPTPDITIGHNATTDEQITFTRSHLKLHTAAFGSAATGKSTHQHTIMRQLADNGHGFCAVNYRDFELDTLLERLPTHRHDDILHLDDNSQVYTDSELKNAVENNQIIFVEHSVGIGEKQQQQFLAEFLGDYWNAVQETDELEHAVFIDRFHELDYTDNFDYSELLAHARRENLAVHINAMNPQDLPKNVRDAVFSLCGRIIMHRTMNPATAEFLTSRVTDVTMADLRTLAQHNAYVRTASTGSVETVLLNPDA